MLFGLPWRFVVGIFFVVAVVALVYFFGEARYRQGVSAEKTRWENAVATAEDHSQQVGAEEAARFEDDVNDLGARLAQGREDVLNATDTRATFLSWARADQRLCEHASGPCGDRGA
jgi:hypothetical protein